MAKKAKNAKKKQHKVVVKELKFGLNIGQHDFDTKIRHAREFLLDGNRVKVIVQFRGREITHPDLGKNLVTNIISVLSDVAKTESDVKLDGKLLTVLLVPKQKRNTENV